MAHEPLYSVMPMAFSRMGSSSSFAATRRHQTVVELDGLTARVLTQCQGARTLTAHAHAASIANAGSVAEIAGALNQLMSAGFLGEVSLDAARRLPASDARGGSPAIDRLIVITADRPEALQRCLSRLQRRDLGRTNGCRLMVIDGSGTCATRNQEVALLDSSSNPVTYVGAGYAAKLRRAIAACGFPTDVLEFALSPGAIGSNRNLATLLTAGHNYVTIDDDVIPDLWVSDNHSDGVVYAGHTELREWTFHDTRQAALAGLRFSGQDVLSAHGRWLDRTLPELDVVPEKRNLQYACSHLTAAIASGKEPRVRLTVAGVAGDSGRYCPHRLLFINGSLGQVLMTDRVAFEMALTSREIRCIAPAGIVTHDHGSCASYCMGVANRTLVPPFMPIGRGEDSVFAAMLAFCDPLSLVSHVPQGVIHGSDRPSMLSRDATISARQTTLAELLLSLVNIAARTPIPADAAERLRWLGQLLIDVGRQDAGDFVSTLGESALGLRCEQLMAADTVLANPGCPSHWKEAIEDYRCAFLDAASHRAFLLPREFHDAPSLAEGFQRTQDFLRLFGRFLVSWPDIWRLAASAEFEEALL